MSIQTGLVTEVYRQARRFGRAQTANIANRLHGARADRCRSMTGGLLVGEFPVGNAAATAASAPQTQGYPPADMESCETLDWVVWAEGAIAIGERGRASGSPPVDFTTGGVTVGIDRRLRQDLIAGMAVGLGRDSADIGNDGTTSLGRNISLAGYGSFTPNQNIFFDVIGGVGLLGYDTHRFIPSSGGFADDERDGTMLFGSLGTGYRHRAAEGWNAEAFARLEGSIIMLDRSTETGAGAGNATYYAETAYGLDGVIGLTASYPISTGMGVLTPRASLEYRHAFANGFTQTVSFQGDADRFDIKGDLGPGGSVGFGIGADLELREDFLIGLEYRGAIGSQGFNQHGVQARAAIRF
jgi:outer membrane autotransporter protein